MTMLSTKISLSAENVEEAVEEWLNAHIFQFKVVVIGVAMSKGEFLVDIDQAQEDETEEAQQG